MSAKTKPNKKNNITYFTMMKLFVRFSICCFSLHFQMSLEVSPFYVDANVRAAWPNNLTRCELSSAYG